MNVLRHLPRGRDAGSRASGKSGQTAIGAGRYVWDEGGLYLSSLAGRYLAGPGGQRLGRLSDVIVQLRGAQYPLVTGLVVRVGRRAVFVPAGQVAALAGDPVQLVSAAFDLRRFERREGEVLLRGDVLGHRLIDVSRARLVRATDLRLSPADAGWVLDGVDTHRRPVGLPHLGGHRRRPHMVRDWREFEPLIGHSGSTVLRWPFARVSKFKPAQIADLIEGASKAEETELLGRVHTDPELEADVFEELDDDLAARLLGARTNTEIAAVLAQMCADDAADAIADLPADRRRAVLDLLPCGQRTRVIALLRFSSSSAGGLMGLEFLALPGNATVADALAAVARSGGLQSEALTSVHAVSPDGRLIGVARLATLLQADLAAELAQVVAPREGGPWALAATAAVWVSGCGQTRGSGSATGNSAGGKAERSVSQVH
jgi:sporulation protein YlmC with PRC-barrel domain